MQNVLEKLTDKIFNRLFVLNALLLLVFTMNTFGGEKPPIIVGENLYTVGPLEYSKMNTQKGMDEREAVLRVAQRYLYNTLSTYEKYEFDRPKEVPKEYTHSEKIGRWASLKLENEVYFKVSPKNDGYKLYTIYATSDKTTPKDYKVQFYAKEIPSPQKGFTIEMDGSGRTAGKEFIVINSQGETVMKNEYRSSSTLVEFPLDPKKEKTLIPVEGFFNEKSYGPPPAPRDSKLHVDLDPDLIFKTAPVAIAELAAWKASNKFGKLNAGKLKILRQFGKVLLVVEQGGHIINAYEVVNEGGKPKYSALSPELLGKLENIAIKTYDEVKDLMKTPEETGVLRDESQVKKDLESPALVPHVQKSESPATHSGTTPTTRPVEPESNDIIKQILKQELLKSLKSEKPN